MGKIVQKIDPDFELVSKSQSSLVECCPFITYETRVRLIKMVIQEKVKTRRATRNLGINMSTAKNILKVFRKYGRIHVRKQERGKIFPQNILQDIKRAKQMIKQEDEKLLKKDQKILNKKVETKEKEEKMEKMEKNMNQNKVLEENIQKKMSNDVPEFKGRYYLIKKSAQQVLVQNIPKTIANVPKSEYYENPIKEQTKQYYPSFFNMNMSHQNMNLDPLVKNQNVMIGPDFPDFYPYHPYYLQNFYY